MIHDYKKKWPRRAYLGPLAKIQRDVAKTIRRKLKVTARVYRKPLARRSPERRRQDRIYNARVNVWLTEPGNDMCFVFLVSPEFRHQMFVLDRTLTTPRATQCHHVHGRGYHGELLMIEYLWKPVSAAGHAWIDANRDKARKLGLLAPLGQYNRKPL